MFDASLEDFSLPEDNIRIIVDNPFKWDHNIYAK